MRACARLVCTRVRVRDLFACAGTPLLYKQNLFRFYRREDGKVVSGCRPFSRGRHALRFISEYAGKNLIDDIYFVDAKARKCYDVVCDYNRVKLLPCQSAFDFQYD